VQSFLIKDSAQRVPLLGAVARCSSKWCNTGCKPNMALNRVLNRRHGKYCVGWLPKMERLLTVPYCLPAPAWP